MKVFGKPKNRWGWVRAAGLAVLAGVLAWTFLAAVLRSTGEVPWLAWSGYRAFTLLDGLDLAILPLLAAVIGSWLEDHDFRVETEHSNRREAEQALAAQRGAILNSVHEAIQAELAGWRQAADELQEGIPEQARLRLYEIVLAALPELDGKGMGELLHFLFEQGFLHGEKPGVALTGADFHGAIIQNAQLNGISLNGVVLKQARLDGCHLAKARLSGANLRKSFLRHADLREAALAGANLSGAHLEHANLEGADLLGANLDNAHLQHATMANSTGITQASLDQAVLIDTILPDGQKVTNQKGKEYLRNKELAALVDRL